MYPVLLPGFAADEVVNHGVIDKRSDIYSFGKTFTYVLDEGNIKSNQTITHILNRCIQENKQDRYLDFISLRRDLLKLPKQHHPVIKKPIYYFIASFILFSLGSFFHQEYDFEQRRLYQIAITQKKYEEASYIYPEKMELYQLAYDQYATNEKVKKDDKVTSCLYLEALIKRNKMMENEDIASYFALKCMEAENMQCYQKAYAAFSNMKDLKRKKPLYEGYRQIAYMLGFNKDLNTKEVDKLLTTMRKMIALLNDLADVNERYHQYEILLQIFITRRSQFTIDSYIQEISLLDKMEALVIEYPMIEKDLKNLRLRQANVYYERGMWFYAHQKTKEMKNDFQKAMKLFSQQPMEGETKHKMASMKLYTFEFCIEPKEQKKSVYLLKEGIEILNSIPKMNTTEFGIYHSLTQKYAQWREE